MTKDELEAALKGIDCDQETIDKAFYEEFAQKYRPSARRATPLVKTALDGSREVSPQSPIVEAWLTYSLSFRDTELNLQELMETADSINKMVPTPDEISYTFLQLSKRGWLTENEHRYGLTIEARHAIRTIVGEGDVFDEIERLEKWIATHPR